MERIIIGGEAVEVPDDVVSDSRDAVVAWHTKQLTDRKIPFTLVNGTPVETPPKAASPSPTPAPAASAPAPSSPSKE